MNQPERDGLDHINIYSKGRTELGRMLSNWADLPVDLPEGRFRTIEGYWFYLLDQSKDPRWAGRSGYEAKYLGKPLEKAPEPADFKRKIEQALCFKLAQHPQLAEALKNSKLPLDHYYVYAGRPIPAGFSWITSIWETLRMALQESL